MTVIESIETCPRCRGYSLESQWCSTCKGAGFIAKRSAEPMYTPLPASILDAGKEAQG